MNLDQSSFSSLPPLKNQGRLSTSQILLGQPIPKIERLRAMSEDEFEDMINELAHGNFKELYADIKQFGGAGDKGRDIVGFYSDGSVDIFQCKHYSGPIAPTTFYVELGKIVYYTHRGDYPIPKAYYILAPHGCGPKLLDMIADPAGLKAELKKNWAEYCQRKITSIEDVRLEVDIEEYLDALDLSFIQAKDPAWIIEEHAKTVYHPARFGGGLLKFRRLIPEAPNEIQGHEMVYTDQLFKVYSEEAGKPLTSLEEVKAADSRLYEDFSQQRVSFYCAESLDKFSRENFPDANPAPFEELKQDSKHIISTSLLSNRRKSGLDKLIGAIQEMNRADFSANPLSLNSEIRPVDRQGICHVLANGDHVKWID